MKKILIIIGVLIILAYIITTAMVVVDETEVVIITHFGNPVKVADNAGLVVKWPDPIQTALRFDKRLQALDSNIGEFLTRDKKNLVVGNFILWKIVDAKKFIQSVRDNVSAKQRLSDLVGSEIGAAIGSHTLGDFLTVDKEGSHIASIMQDVQIVSKEVALEEFGIEIVDIRLRRLGFPSQNLRSVYDRMRAERERMAKKYRAEGEEEAAKIRAQTEQDVRELLANAYREGEIAKGKGEAEAIAVYADAFKKDPKFYKLTRTLQAYRNFMGSNTTLILSTKSPLFRYLESPPEN